LLSGICAGAVSFELLARYLRFRAFNDLVVSGHRSKVPSLSHI